MPISGPPLERPFDTSELLARGLASNPDDPALVSRNARWSWRQLDRVSTCFAGNLLDMGLSSGDRVASLMPNRCEVIVFYIACMKAGLVAVPLNYRYKGPEIDYALSVGGASVLFAHDERAEDLAASRLANNLSFGVIGYNEEGGAAAQLTLSLQREGPYGTSQSKSPRRRPSSFLPLAARGSPKG